jgi:hypothetical protein
LLAVDNKSSEATRRAFEAVARDPTAPHRVLLLVNMGTEGWNCPSLFACALVRKLATSNNFVLQAATRCLRQVPGNVKPARVYLTASNKKTLEDQLTETYGTSLKALDAQHAERVEKTIHLHQPNLPPLLIKKRVLRIQRRAEIASAAPLTFTVPDLPAPLGPLVQTWSPVQTANGGTHLQRQDAADVLLEPYTPMLDGYTAAARLAASYHLPIPEILAALRHIYEQNGLQCPSDKREQLQIQEHHIDALGQQIEAQRNQYEETWDEIEVAVALVKADGFERTEVDGLPVYTARISFDKSHEHLYKTAQDTADAALALKTSFHYEGYNFDSAPEAEFLDWTLALLQTQPHQIEGLWFTGGLTDAGKTDLRAEYLGDDGRWHTYTPDFVLRRADGKHLVVEVKNDKFSPDISTDLARHAQGQAPQTQEGRKAVALKRWEQLNPERLSYHVMFADTALLDEGKKLVRDFICQKHDGAGLLS